MSDGFVVFIGTSCIIAMFGLAYAMGNGMGKGSVVNDCKAVGVFHVNGQVFDCKLREAK